MSRRLPNLNQLRAFEAAARHLSFKHAAEELHVTHAAVSHQIKALEDQLGQQLFHRRTRQVELTEAAVRFAARLGTAFDQIAEASADLGDGRMEGTLRLSFAPFFGNRMVLPRLARFSDAYPDLRIVPDMESGVTDFSRSDIDGAIRYGHGGWKGLSEVLLWRNRVAPFAAPSYVKRFDLPMDPADIAGLNLGSVSGRAYHWSDWFEAAGYTPDRELMLIEYSNKARALDLALSGNGIALDDVTLIAEERDAGRLVQLHPVVVEQDTAMYLVFPKTAHPDPRLLAFAAWLKAEFDDEAAREPGAEAAPG